MNDDTQHSAVGSDGHTSQGAPRNVVYFLNALRDYVYFVTAGSLCITPLAWKLYAREEVSADVLGPYTAVLFWSAAIACFDFDQRRINDLWTKTWRADYYSSVLLRTCSVAIPAFISGVVFLHPGLIPEVAKDSVRTFSVGTAIRGAFDIGLPVFVGVIYLVAAFSLFLFARFLFEVDTKTESEVERGHKPKESHADYADEVGGDPREREIILQAAKSRRLEQIRKQKEQLDQEQGEVEGRVS